MKKRFIVLDGFRGLFAMIVAVFHYTPGPGLISYTRLISHGTYFTDFFFVLSGFVIYYNYNSLGSGKLKTFFYKRFIRLYPLRFFMLLVFLIFEIIKFLLLKFSIFQNPAFFNNNFHSFIGHLLLVQAYGIPGIWGSWNAPSWSISAEFFSYFIFGVTILVLRKYSLLERVISYLLLSLLFLIIIYLVNKNLDVRTEQYGIFRCGYSFFLGCVSCNIYETILRKNLFKNIQFTVLEIFSLLASLLSIMYLPKNITFVIPLFFLVTIVVFSFESGWLSKLLNSNYFRLLGTLSYSIYMTHYLVMYIFKIFLLGIIKTNNSLFYDFAIIPYLITIILISYFTYNNVELKGKILLEKLLVVTPQKQTA